MVLEATMIRIDNSEWPPRCFSNEKPLFWINLFRQRSPEHRRAPAGQAKISTVSTRVTPSRDQAFCRADAHPYKGSGGYYRVP